jgi:intracellular sulfur oxidation DsrE/DsrF family protein
MSRKEPTMQRLTAAATAIALGLGLAASASAQEAPDLVTVVTSEQPQVQLMSMVLTMQAVEQGKSVHMLLCGAGGDLALADAPDTATAPQPPRDMSPQGLLTALIGRGVTVEVCAIYLPGLGADESVLIDGVGVAQPPAMAGAMLGEGTAVWSF